MDLATNLALAQALGQNGVKMKAEIMATGYGQPLLDQPASKSLGPEVVLVSLWAPVEIQSKATKRFQADLKKYAGYTGVPDFGVYTGYITCDLAILGLQRQGDHLNPSTFSDDLRSVGQFNVGGGLGCSKREPQSRNLRRSSRLRAAVNSARLRVGTAGQERKVRGARAQRRQDVVLDRRPDPRISPTGIPRHHHEHREVRTDDGTALSQLK